MKLFNWLPVFRWKTFLCSSRLLLQLRAGSGRVIENWGGLSGGVLKSWRMLAAVDNTPSRGLLYADVGKHVFFVCSYTAVK